MHLLLPPKFDRILHDACAGILNRVSPALTFADDADAIASSRQLAPADESTWANPFENEFYQTNDIRTAAHAPARLLELRDICVTGSEAFVFSDRNTVLRLCASLDKHPVRKIRRPLRSLALRIDEPVFLLGGRAPGNRGHFLVEHLPRLLLAQQALGSDLPRKVLVTPGHGAWQSEYLRAFGFGDLEVIEASPGTTWCRRAVTVPNLSLTGRAELAPPALYQELAARLQLPPVSAELRTPVFLTRKDAPGRHLVNEDAIFGLALRSLPGLRRVSLARLSVIEQARLFTQASVVIGPHSQAFRGSLYARDALIVQLVPGRRSHENEYRFWADNYSLLGTLHGNRPVSLYADDAHAGAHDSTYPAGRFSVELDDLLHRASRRVAS